MSKRGRWALGAIGAITLSEAALIHLGRTYGSTKQERARELPGDRIVDAPQVVTDHAITIDAPPSAVWPWLVQMGWGRGGWYTARWVDRLLFPANAPSADRIIPELQDITVGTFIPDGPPHTECGLIVEIDRNAVSPGNAACAPLPRAGVSRSPRPSPPTPNGTRRGR